MSVAKVVGGGCAGQFQKGEVASCSTKAQAGLVKPKLQIARDDGGPERNAKQLHSRDKEGEERSAEWCSAAQTISWCYLRVEWTHYQGYLVFQHFQRCLVAGTVVEERPVSARTNASVSRRRRLAGAPSGREARTHN